MAYIVSSADDTGAGAMDEDDVGGGGGGAEETFVSAIEETGTVKKAPTFLSATDRPARDYLNPHGGHGGQDARRNLLDVLTSSTMVMGEETSASVMLPAPSPKDTVRVYLRVKPKTEEEREIWR